MQSMTVFDLHLSMIDINEIENHDTTDSRSRVDEKDTDVFHDHSSLLKHENNKERNGISCTAFSAIMLRASTTLSVNDEDGEGNSIEFFAIESSIKVRWRT